MATLRIQTQPTPAGDPPRLGYNRAEAAALYGVSPKVIRTAILSGKLKAKRIGSRDYVTSEALRAWFESLEDA